jgi:signal transduction histidine kinase
MPLSLLSQVAPDVRTLFIVNVVTIGGVIVFAAAVIGVSLRRIYLRRVQEEKMIAVGQAAARILHQVKNPLQTVMLQAELLQEPGFAENAALREDSCEAIVGEAGRLANMLNELGLWASGSRRALHLEPIALHELIRHLAETEGRHADAEGIRLNAAPIAEATVLADPYFLRQAVENLVRNAREAVAGQTDARVDLALECDGTSARIRVADNGPGIPRDRIVEVFQPFVSSKGKGMGLGLPICKEIIEGHSGRLEVQSYPGVGTVFQVFLPFHTGTDDKRQSADSRRKQ